MSYLSDERQKALEPLNKDEHPISWAAYFPRSNPASTKMRRAPTKKDAAIAALCEKGYTKRAAQARYREIEATWGRCTARQVRKHEANIV